MDVTIHEDSAVPDIEVSITCPRIDERVTRIVASLNTFDAKIVGVIEGVTTILNLDDVLYCESVDRKTFIYTKAEVFESPLRLYELKDKLAGTEFIQISKQMIVNFDKVTSIKPHFNARLQITLSNGEAAIVSRQYSPDLKKKIGIL